MDKAEDWVDRAKALSAGPTSALVAACLDIARARPPDDHDDWHVRWSLVATIHERGGATEFNAGEFLIQSSNVHERELGCDILGQLGWSRQQFHDESVDLLVGRLADDDVNVVAAAATALGHRRSPRAIEPALALLDHPSAMVRLGAVHALSCHEDRRATDTLIHLSRDMDRDVRDWATFGLGSMCQADYPELRTALHERLSDADQEVCWEAMQGLAQRKDSTVIPAIAAALLGDDVYPGHLEAAATAANPALLPALLKLKAQSWSAAPSDAGYWSSCLDAAIAACTPALPGQ